MVILNCMCNTSIPALWQLVLKSYSLKTMVMHSERAVGRRVSETFQTAGIREDMHVSATNTGKLYSSAARELSPAKKRLINAHMKHKESTADSNYVIKVNAEKSSKAHDLMRSIITGKQLDDLNNDVWKPKENIGKEVPNPETEDEEADQEPEDEEANQSCTKVPSAPLPQAAQEA